MSEIEVKILNINEEEISKKLVDLGAVLVKRENQTNYIFDFEGDALRKNYKGYCRIRKVQSELDGSEKNILTVKKMLSQEKYKKMLEEETEIADFEAMKRILEELGMQIRHISQKKRKSYQLNSILFEIDEWDKHVYPSPYLEIEAANEELLHQGLELLGYTLEDTTSKTIDEMRKDLGLEEVEYKNY